MTVKELSDMCGFKALCIPDPDRTVEGCYIGDLLSWVMGRAEADNVWITIMSNANIAAVASLADVACVLLAEDVVPDEDVLQVGNEKHINILSSPLPQFETAVRVYKAFSAGDHE